MSSLYDRPGGEVAVVANVDGLYAHALADELTRPFYPEPDMEAQVLRW